MWLALPNMQKKRIAISVDHLQLHRSTYIVLSSKERYLALELNNQSVRAKTKNALCLCARSRLATDDHLVKLSVQ